MKINFFYFIFIFQTMTYIKVIFLCTMTKFHASENHTFEPYQIYNNVYSQFKQEIEKYYKNEELVLIYDDNNQVPKILKYQDTVENKSTFRLVPVSQYKKLTLEKSLTKI